MFKSMLIIFEKFFDKMLCQFKNLQYLCTRFEKEMTLSTHMLVC